MSSYKKTILNYYKKTILNYTEGLRALKLSLQNMRGDSRIYECTAIMLENLRLCLGSTPGPHLNLCRDGVAIPFVRAGSL